jgi:hypothetical protein
LKSDLNDASRIICFESFDIHLVGRQGDIGEDPSLMSGTGMVKPVRSSCYWHDKGARDLVVGAEGFGTTLFGFTPRGH